MHSFFHRHFISALIAVPLLGWVAAHTPLVQQKESKITPIHYTPAFFKLITAGYWPAAVETMWILNLQEIGQNRPITEGAEEVKAFYDLATDLDPYFYELYEQAGVYFSFFKEDGKTAEHFFEKGIRAYEERVLNQMPPKFQNQFWHHPYSLYIYLAYTEGYVLQDWQKAKEAYLKAADVKGAPSYLQHMKTWLKEEGSERMLGIKILKVMISNLPPNTDSEQIKQKYQEKLKALESAL